MSRGLNRPPHENARTYPETCGRYAPRITTVALPEQEEEEQKCGEDLSDSGSDSESDLPVGGGLMCTSYGDPEASILFGSCPRVKNISRPLEKLRFDVFD